MERVITINVYILLKKLLKYNLYFPEIYIDL